MTSRDHVLKRWLTGLKFLIKGYCLAKFSGYRHCRSKDKAAKIYYVTFKDQIIKESNDFMEGSSSLYIPTLPKLVARDIALMDI